MNDRTTNKDIEVKINSSLEPGSQPAKNDDKALYVEKNNIPHVANGGAIVEKEVWGTGSIGTIFLYAPCPGTPLYYEVCKAGYQPPQSLAEWGEFIIGDRAHSDWHPFIDYLTAVSLCSKRGRPFNLNISLRRLLRFNLPGILMDILGHFAYCKWQKRDFRYSLDLKLLRALNRLFYKV